MTYAEIEQMARREIDDETGEGADRRIDYWQMLAYANEAESEACLRSSLLVDSTTAAVCSINIVEGTADYPLDPRIFFILRAKMSGAKYPLSKVSRTIIDQKRPGWEDESGKIECLVSGMNSRNLRTFRNPSENGTLWLTVVRAPLIPMSKNEDIPEINSYHHPSLVLWIKHKVYNNQDSELFDKNRSDVHLALFEQKFGKSPADVADVLARMPLIGNVFDDQPDVMAGEYF